MAADGRDGLPGPAGPAGPPGRPGIQGIRGPSGAAGGQGPIGPRGHPGPQGLRGDAGPPGQRGATGAQGPRGIDGPVGPQGKAGSAGPRGERGPEGPPGPEGERGPAPAHEWDGPKLRFRKPDGQWGAWADLEGRPGRDGVGGIVVSGGTAAPAQATELVTFRAAEITLDSASRNSDQLRDVIDAARAAGGGRVAIAGGQGVIPLAGTFFVPSDFDLQIGAGSALVNYTDLDVGSTNVPMFINDNWQSPVVEVSGGIVDTYLTPGFFGERLATADCGANPHLLEPGNYVLIKDFESNKYTNVWRVLDVVDEFVFTFICISDDSHPIGATSGYVSCQRADANIIIGGAGEIDYRGQFNQTDYSYNSMLSIFNKVANLQISVSMRNSPKYNIYWSNLIDAVFENMTQYGASAAIEGVGFGMNIIHRGIAGATADDFIAYTTDNTAPGASIYDFPNGDLVGPLIGFTVLDVHVHKTNINAVGVYSGVSHTGWTISGINLQRITCSGQPRRVISLYASGLDTLRDVVIRDIITVPPADVVIQIAGEEGIDPPDLGRYRNVTIENVSISGRPLADKLVNIFHADVENLTLDGSDRRYVLDSSGGRRYLIQASDDSSLREFTVRRFKIANSGGSGSAVLAHSGDQADFLFARMDLNGDATLLEGQPTLNPRIRITDSHFNDTTAIYIGGALRLTYDNNTHGALAGSPAIYAYGSGYTAELRIRTNDFGSTNSWLRFGGEPGDTLTVNLWHLGNIATADYGTDINFVATSGNLYMRACDASLPIDAARVPYFVPGCVFKNSNAAYGAGRGIYVVGDAPTRVATIT